LQQADRLVLPGVGTAQAGMAALIARGLDDMLLSYQRPLLGICLGMQLLYTRSREGDTNCLGLFEGEIEPLPDSDGPVPHMGWNTLSLVADDPLLAGLEQNSYVYFVHSYAARPDENALAITRYGMAFSAVVRRDNVYGCQFHPERSGKAGARILQNFLEVS
jgi:glutamine amidotransferase